MPCPTCGCVCCDRIVTVGAETIIALDGLAGRFLVLPPDYEDQIIGGDKPMTRAELVNHLVTMIDSKAIDDEDPKPFHQRLNRKAWER